MEKYKKLSLLLNKSKEELERFNVADMFIDDDTGYYLDIDELLKVNEMNNNALMDTYLKAIRKIKDLDKNIVYNKYFKEPEYCHLGTTLIGTYGKGLKHEAAYAIIQEIKSRFDFYKNPSNIYHLPRVWSSIGNDAINDMICNIFLEDMLTFTEIKCKEMKIKPKENFIFNNKLYNVLTYNKNNKTCPIIFYPKSALKKYIFVLTYEEIIDIYYNKINKKITKKDIMRLNKNFLYEEITHSDIEEKAKINRAKRENNLNNIDLYNVFAEDIINQIDISNITDSIDSVKNYAITLIREGCTRLISYHNTIFDRHIYNFINVTHYKYIVSFICVNINKELENKKFKTRILCKESGFYIYDSKSYIRIQIRTDYNSTCVKQKEDENKFSLLKDKENIMNIIIINNTNREAYNFLKDTTINDNYEFIVFDVDKQ